MIYFILRSGAGGLAIIIKKLGLIDSRTLVTPGWGLILDGQLEK